MVARPAERVVRSTTRLLLSTTHVVLFASSVVLNAISLLLVPKYVGGLLGIGLLVGLVANVGLGALGIWGLRSMSGTVGGALGWFVVVAVVLGFHPGGDVLLAGSLAGDHAVVTVSTLWVFAGFVSYVAVCAFAMVRSAVPAGRIRTDPVAPSEPGTTPSG